MNVAYQALMKNNVEVYSVKTDAFVIDACNLGKAKNLLNFGVAIASGDTVINSVFHPSHLKKTGLEGCDNRVLQHNWCG